ncbi:MAG: hypothetical protein IJV75_04225 [Alphaproteobacteria bacterium]|nr:hypothetical protein [Alphaproteobacteria bacterium]
MALKDTLLAASLGATMIAGTNTEAKETVAPPIAPQQMQTLSPAEIQEMNFQKNYRHLYKNVDGAWFSFGDEKTLRESLYKISSFPMGREIIAGIPPNLEFGSTHFIPNFSYKDGNGNVQNDTYGGLYNWIDNKLDVNTSFLDSDSFYHALRTDVLFHELLHAYQRQNGIMMLDNPSIEQSLLSQKLIEAEAFGWNEVLQTVQRITSGSIVHFGPSEGAYHLTAQQVKDLMHRDLVAEERKFCKKANISFDEVQFKKKDAVYRFQKALIACRGDYAKAQQRMVGEKIKERMAEENTNWSNIYNTQAIMVTKKLCNMGKISRTGNKIAYNHMLKYYQNRYNVSFRDVMDLRLTPNQQKAVDILKKDMDKYNAYSDTNRRLGQSIGTHYKGGR